MPKIPSQEVQQKASELVTSTYREYKKLNEPRNNTLLEVYKAFSSYGWEGGGGKQWQMRYKINKAHEVIERVLPRIVAKNPKWLVSPRKQYFQETELPPVDPNDPESVIKRNETLKDLRSKAVDWSKAIQDYLTYLFDEYDFNKRIRALAKQQIVTGKGRARIGWKYETAKIVKKKEEEVKETILNEMGEEVEDLRTEQVQYVEEQVVGERPTIEVRSFSNVLTDPRYKDIEDMPAYIEWEEGVRLADLYRKDEYFNLDKLKDICGLDYTGMENSQYVSAVRTIAQINNLTVKSKVDQNALTVCKYYGYFNETTDLKKEKLYEITFNLETEIIIGFKEIAKIPMIEVDCFEDTETNFAVGFVEPILGLQKELNFKKNSASDYINLALNRSFIWSPKSGIDPRDLISKPNGIIVTTKDAQTALANCVELPLRNVHPDFFQEQNDIERQIQQQTFTIDTSNPKGQQALTNTATGARIEFFESNVVLDQVRKQFEEGLSKLAYLLLQETFENMEENITFKKQGTEDYWEMNKELLRDAVQRYTIKVEVNSTSFDSIESRRSDAIAFFNMLMQSAQAGANVDIEKATLDVAETFEKKNPEDYIKPANMQAIEGQLPGGSIGPEAQGEMPPPGIPAGVEGQAQLTEDVAGGSLTGLA